MNIFFERLLHSLLHSLKETAIVIPFMFLAFIFIGLIERGAGRKMIKVILAADKIGPLPGGLLGIVPSCGFSAAASNLFGAGLLTVGTLLAVYISTSDEMLAVMVSSKAEPLLILKILAIKGGCGILYGFLIDGALRLFYRIFRKDEYEEYNDIDADEAAEECACTDGCCAANGNLFRSAIMRTLRTVLFIFIISVVLNIVFEYVDKAAIGAAITKIPFVGNIVTALLGLIPNCAVSVALTELYLEGVITEGMMLSGLMTGAGSGLLVLIHSNRNIKENIFVIIALFLGGLCLGSLCGAVFF